MNIYLASPYTHADPEVMERRYYDAVDYAAFLIERGKIVFSPIAHSHGIGQAMRNSADTAFWTRLDLSFLDTWADIVLVLCIPGYLQSRGIRAEVEHALALGLPVVYSKERASYAFERLLYGYMLE